MSRRLGPLRRHGTGGSAQRAISTGLGVVVLILKACRSKTEF